jgi:aspartyl-tRNA(Asn)/glutamyl-tRNA(Gln) amidotransferase subunit B
VAATPIVEVKNLNSFRAVERAMKYEAQRQYSEFQAEVEKTGRPPEKAPKTTAGWDDARGVTNVQRGKEEASDYRYFPEPDLVPVVIDAVWLERARAAMGELPAAMRARLQQQYGLSKYDAGVLTSQGRPLVKYFEEVASRSGDARAANNWITNQVLSTLKEQKVDIGEFKLSSSSLAELIAEQKKAGLNKQMAVEVYERVLESGCTPRAAMDQLGIKPPPAAGDLAEIVRQAIAANPKAVADFKKGKTAAAQAIKGAVMKATRGTANPVEVQRLLDEELTKA